VGRSIFAFVDEGSVEMMKTQLEHRRQGLAEVYEINFRRRDGAKLPGLVSDTPLMADGAFSGSLAVFTDISFIKEAEGKLRSAIAFRDTIINSITDNLIVIDPSDCRIIMANESFLSRGGWISQKVTGKPCYEVMHSFLNARGQERIYQIATYPHFDHEGKVDLVVCLERDVTDRRKMEEVLAFRSRELQKTQLQLEKLFEISRERMIQRESF